MGFMGLYWGNGRENGNYHIERFGFSVARPLPSYKP